MGIVSDLNSKRNNATTGQSAMENVAVKITEYGVNETFVGVRIDTGEQVNVRLRPLKNGGNSRFPRPEYANFIKVGDKTHTEIGGVILFDSCYTDNKGDLSARWATSLSHKPNQSLVVVGQSRLSSGENENTGNQWMRVDFAKVDKHSEANTVAGFEQAMLEALKPTSRSASPSAIIRLTDKLDGSKGVIFVSSGKHKNASGFQETFSAQESYGEFMSSHDDSELVVRAVEDSGTIVEVVPSVSVFGGIATKENFFKNEVKRKRLESCYLVSDVSPEGENITYTGYVNSIITMRAHSDGTPYITNIQPVSSSPVAVSAADLLPSRVAEAIQEDSLTEVESELSSEEMNFDGINSDEQAFIADLAESF